MVDTVDGLVACFADALQGLGHISRATELVRVELQAEVRIGLLDCFKSEEHQFEFCARVCVIREGYRSAAVVPLHTPWFILSVGVVTIGPLVRDVNHAIFTLYYV